MNSKKIILLSAIVIFGALTLGQSVYAANPTLSILPTTVSKNIGTAFNVSLQLDPQGNKVCVVKGNLSLNALTCRGITVVPGLIAQTTPTCKSPSFTLGIPQCTTVAQNLLTVSVKGDSVGQATASIAGTKVIGVGVVVASTVNGGTYNITAAPVPAIHPTQPTPAPQATQPVQQPTQATTQPVKQSSASGQQASLATSSPTKTIIIVIVILLAVIIIWGLWYIFSKNKKKK